MSKLNFFVPVTYSAVKSTFCERFCEGVDDYFFIRGRKGFVIKDKSKKIETVEIKKFTQSKQRVILLSALKIFTYSTVVIPLGMLALKAGLRASHTYKIAKKITPAVSKPSNSKEIQNNSAEKINEWWKEYKKLHSECGPMNSVDLSKLQLEYEGKDKSTVRPDHSLGNLILPFEKDKDILFHPNIYYLGYYGFNERWIAAEECSTNYIKDIVETGFATGKSLVILRGGNEKHAFTLAFRKDGKCKIIDSMMSSSINMQHLMNKLNSSGIKDDKGKVINFRGEYINTHLQKGTVDCMRFSTLYAYAIAKTKKLGAYKYVNAAIKNDELQSFEDIHTLKFNEKLKDASAISNKKYHSLMFSWALRTLGLKWNHWEDIRVSELPGSTTMREVTVLSSQGMPRSYPVTTIITAAHLKRSLVILKNEEQKSVSDLKRELILDKDPSSIALKDLIPSKKGQKVAILKDGDAWKAILLESEEVLQEAILDTQTGLTSYNDLAH